MVRNPVRNISTSTKMVWKKIQLPISAAGKRLYKMAIVTSEKPDIITLPAREKKCLLLNFAKNLGKAITLYNASSGAAFCFFEVKYNIYIFHTLQFLLFAKLAGAEYLYDS